MKGMVPPPGMNVGRSTIEHKGEGSVIQETIKRIIENEKSRRIDLNGLMQKVVGMLCITYIYIYYKSLQNLFKYTPIIKILYIGF